MPDELLEIEASDSSLRSADALEAALGAGSSGSTSSPSGVLARIFAGRLPGLRSGSASCSPPHSRVRGWSGRWARSVDLGCLAWPSLERVRDALAARLREAQAELERRGWIEEQNRGLVEAMTAEPQRYPWVRVSNEDVGEPGCKHWHSRPRWGILGMLMGWWRVKLSSGCPLTKGCRPPHPGE